jgi:hypothetical protein
MQATWSQPVAEVVVFSNDFARRRERPMRAVGDLDTPGVPDGPEGGLLVVPPDPADLDVVVATESAGRSGRDPSVHQDQLEPVGDALPAQVLQHQLAGTVLVG